MGFLDSLFGIDDAKEAIRRGAEQSRGALQSGYDDISSMYSPYREGGGKAFSTLQALAGLGGPGAAGIAYDQFRQSPGYMAGLNEGIGAIDRSAVGRASGNVLRDLTKFGQDYADRGFADYYNRIAGIGDVGYGATGATAGARGNLSSGLAGIYTNQGNQEANASLAGGNLLMGGINTLAGLAGFGFGGGFGIPTSGSFDMRKYTGVNDPRKYGTLY